MTNKRHHHHLRVCLSVCVCHTMCVYTRVRMCTGVRHIQSLTHSFIFVFVCARHPVFCEMCAPGSPWNNRWRSCIGRTRVASAAPCSSYRTAWYCCRCRPLRPPSLASGFLGTTRAYRQHINHCENPVGVFQKRTFGNPIPCTFWELTDNIQIPCSYLPKTHG